MVERYISTVDTATNATVDKGPASQAATASPMVGRPPASVPGAAAA